MFPKDWRLVPIAEDSTHFKQRIWSNQARSDSKVYSWGLSFVASESTIQRCQGTKATNSPTYLWCLWAKIMTSMTKYPERCNSGIYILVVTNNSLIGFQAFSIRKSCLILKHSEQPVANGSWILDENFLLPLLNQYNS